MLRKFKISIDGKEYLVEMEEIGAVQPTVAQTQPLPAEQIAPQAAPEVAKEEVVTAAPVVSPAGAEALPAPMPGTILKVLVNVGDSVSENQPLLILEAMKMENEIVASQAGTVSAIHVTPGQVVNAGDGLISIG
ncbi:acetyl-CoA carboxylase biotin carboxyl carrier protein subunit [Streptococcus iniae]|uniref:Acetyl-CoA carboxylase n=1 Tax=Streptococcus iniae TaxID=1346 RepID=A0A1J0MXF2_STRIN|nr:acetyl-CoA carboxylase biotin carboxyl carrier protein subunit [Streptococcus iniae]AGM98173.1 glutaconyl-CoA decarboxylase subunit gamma [Streptococcus iniae SF1]AHY15238.1 acetyl-CoA carboxylase [Streptococcus iniae]AHY17107.1 acetyl-CoA carboxylase [Streptococcus iniae]AJG25419.1 acetyl-CoA carboxylase [Streptococcus iniae]APD31289.1 acetyl-CoA carboxylase biotin carboxyl carrier protein subunit [Streptococcus iniae]